MKVKPEVTRMGNMSILVIFILSATLATASTAVDAQEKTIASTKGRSLFIRLTSESGKFEAGENHFCVLLQSATPTSVGNFKDLTVDFTLLVGRLEEAPLTAHLRQTGADRFCGQINLGRQYYHPASYYAFVRYVDGAGKKRSARLSLTVT